MPKKSKKRILEADELQPMVEPMEGTAIPAETAPVAESPALEVPAEDAATETLEAPVEVDMPEVESALGDVELTDQQISEIEAAKKEAEVNAAVDLAKKITGILNSKDISTAMETGETALNTVLPSEEAVAEEEEGTEPMVQSAKYTDTELEMLKEYRENYSTDISDEELVAKYREYVESQVDFEDASEAIPEEDGKIDEIIEDVLDTEVDIDDAAKNISITEGYSPEFAEELEEEVPVEEEIEEEIIEEEDDSELLDKISDFLSKYDLDDSEDISDAKEELEADLEALYAMESVLKAEEFLAEEEEEAEEVELEAEAEEEALVEDEVEAEEELAAEVGEASLEEDFPVESIEDEDVLIERRLASRKRLLENHRRHFREEASPRRAPCPRPTRDFEDEDSITLSEAYDTEKARSASARRRNDLILSRRYSENYGSMDYYTKDNLRENHSAPRKPLTRKEFFEDYLDREEELESRPSRTVTARREALAKARGIREREAHSRQENPRFKEALNRGSRISEEKEPVDPNSWKANKFIDKFNEKIEFNFEEFLRNGFLG